jgi:uncharacterized OB-fold protein
MDDPRIPPTDADAAPFFAGCREGVLRIQQCAQTGRLIFPPRPMSPFAPHVPPTWTTVSGRGSIWSFVVPHPPLLPPFQELAPYVVIAVALDEDPCVRLIGNLVAHAGDPIDQISPDAVRIGARVRAVFEAIDANISLPRWVLDGA